MVEGQAGGIEGWLSELELWKTLYYQGKKSEDQGEMGVDAKEENGTKHPFTHC